MNSRLVLLHGWGATAEDLEPLGRSLAASMNHEMEVMALEAPPSQPPGRRGTPFPADWDAVPQPSEASAAVASITLGAPMKRTVLLGFPRAPALHSGCSLPWRV